ncbi:MAG: F0F1 ATP synthase subunit A [Turicibacter sp.]|nr:F0F1 ATP synthase subunit A [Turicibacter sp.]
MEISAELSLGSRVYDIHPQVINGWLISIVIWIVLIIAAKKVEKADPTAPPKGLALFLEMLVEGVDDLVAATMGKHNMAFAPFIGSLVLFISVANLMGMFHFETPTSDINVTLALAVFTMGMMVYTGIKFNGGVGTFSNLFFGEFPWLFPIEVVSQLARPVSLAFRLFGVVLSGEILLNLVNRALGWFTPVIVPFLQIYFDLFDGLVQVYIFIVLAMIWTSMLTETIHEEHKV